MMRVLVIGILVGLSVVQGGLAQQSGGLNHWVVQPPAVGVYTGAAVGHNSNERSCRGLSSAVSQVMQFCDSQYNIDNLPNILTDGRTSEMSAQGTIPVITLGCAGNGTPTSGGRVTYAAIASGAFDAELSRDAMALRRYAAHFPKTPWIMMRPFHEFNENIGNPPRHPNRNNCYSMPESVSQMQTEFIAAYRHVVTFMIGQGATNVTWLWCPAVGPATWQHAGGDDLLRGFWPGDEFVDWTCADTYDKGSRGVDYTFQHIGFFKQFHKPLIIAETAECNADAPSAKCLSSNQSQAKFITDLSSALRPGGSLYDDGVRAWMYFDQAVRVSGYNWSLDRGGLDSLKSLVKTEYFHPPVPPPQWNHR